MNLFQKFRDGLKKTSTKLAAEIKRIVTRAPKLDAEALDDLEAVLIASDIGIGTTTRIIDQTKAAAKQAGTADVFAIARAEIERELGVAAPQLIKAGTAPTVILLAGVNGTGKTIICKRPATRFCWRHATRFARRQLSSSRFGATGSGAT